MKVKSVLALLLVGFFAMSCGPKDSEIQKEISSKMGEMPGMQVDVKDGIATISGNCKDETCKESCDSIAKSVKGVKTVVNNCVVSPPPAPMETTVVSNRDEVLNESITNILKAYNGINASVTDGVVTIEGEIKGDQIAPLMQKIQRLKPKKVENKLIIK